MKQAEEEERGSETGVFSDSWSPGKCGQPSGGGEVQPDWPFLHFTLSSGLWTGWKCVEAN